MNSKISRQLSPRNLIYDNNELIGYGCAELYVATIPCWLARVVIAARHYSGRFVNNSYLHLGVFNGRELVGVLQLGYAMNPSSGASVVDGTGNREYMELNRMWVHDSQPRNTESRVLSYTLRLIKHLYPAVQWVQTFADERCGRAGVVYQAANFDYVGSHKTEFYELDGEFYHKIAMTTVEGGGKRSAHLRRNKHRVKQHSFVQYRYIRFLEERVRLRLNAKRFKIQPYPKPGNDT